MAYAVLNFHGLGEPSRALDEGEREYWVTTSEFRQMVAAVAPRHEIGFTFDDGNISDVHIALPILKEFGRSADFFVCAGRLNSPGFLGRDELRALVDAGMRIGSHGWSHVPWTALTPEAEAMEWDRAIQTLSAASLQPIISAACPFGVYDRRTIATAKRCNLRTLHTSDRGWAPAGSFLVPRFSVRRSDTAATIVRLIDRARGAIPRFCCRARSALKARLRGFW